MHAETLKGYVEEHATLLEEAKALHLAKRQAKEQKRSNKKRKVDESTTSPSLIKEANAYYASMQSMLAFELKSWSDALKYSKETVYLSS